MNIPEIEAIAISTRLRAIACFGGLMNDNNADYSKITRCSLGVLFSQLDMLCEDLERIADKMDDILEKKEE